MSLYTENLMRANSDGYGGVGGSNPYNIHAALLAEGQTGLNTKRYKDEAALARERLDQLIKESEFRNSMTLAEKGFGTEKELNTMGSTYGLTYRPQSGGTGTPATGLPGSSGGGGIDIANILAQYQGTQQYANKINPGAQMNPLFDPNLSNLNKTLGRKLAQYRG